MARRRFSSSSEIAMLRRMIRDSETAIERLQRGNRSDSGRAAYIAGHRRDIANMHARIRRLEAQENPVKRAMKHKWLPYALGAAVAGGLVYVFWPKTASAATMPVLPPAGGGSPPAIVPGPGNIQIVAGSRVPLGSALSAKVVGSLVSERVTVPARTIMEIQKLDADGTIYFQYNGQLLSSPVEDYSTAVAG